MTKTTVTTAGGAMPKIDRSDLMIRAWAIFRQTYRYPEIKFSDIGRKCFAWALRQAWVEAPQVPVDCLTLPWFSLTPLLQGRESKTIQNHPAVRRFSERGL